MIVRDGDFAPLESFQYLWRWTDARYNLLPEEALAKIRPLRQAKAREAFERSAPWASRREGMLLPPYDLVEKQPTGSTEPRDVRLWLSARVADRALGVIVSWEAETAVWTEWGVFVEYWDDFCYPSGDDILIWPVSEAWLAHYWHEEYFLFSRRATG